MTQHRPLTREDLIAGCRLAIAAREKPVEVGGEHMRYLQDYWISPCGTACCIHGFAALQAGRTKDETRFGNRMGTGILGEYKDVPEAAKDLLYACEPEDWDEEEHGFPYSEIPEAILRILGESP